MRLLARGISVVATGALGLTLASTGAVTTAGSIASAGPISHCTDSQLQVRARDASAAAGHEGVVIRFRNKSSVTCSMRAYPGAAGLNKHGKQIVQAKRTKRGMLGGLKPHHNIPTAILAPGDVASSVIEGTDVTVQGHKCHTLHGLLVTPPNDFDAVHLHQAPPDCDGLQIHPVIKGKTGRQ